LKKVLCPGRRYGLNKALCEAIEMFLNVMEPKRGGITAYNAYHILESLNLMRRGPLGRPNLEKTLGIGDASARTLLKRLREVGIVERTSGGHVLTKRGVELIKIINKYIKVVKLGELPGIKEPYAICLNEFSPPRDLVDVYKVRDYVVREGCRSHVVVGGIKANKPFFPGVPKEVSELMVRSFVINVRESINRGVIIIIGKECLGNALSAMFFLLRDLCEERCKT
jgi:predicted transcriptional regulator